MPLRTQAPLTDSAFEEKGPFSQECPPSVFDAISVDLQGQTNITSGTAVLNDGGFYDLIPEFKLTQGGRQLLALEAPEMRFLAALSKGDANELHPTSVGNDQAFHCPFTIDFSRFMPGAGINGLIGSNRCTMEGRFGEYSDAGTNIGASSSGLNGTLRATVRTVARVGATIMVPRWRMIKTSIADASDALALSLGVTEGAGQFVSGILLRAWDKSTSTGSGLGEGSRDDLVRKIGIRAISRRDQKDVMRRMNWSQVQRAGAQYLGMSVDWNSGALFQGIAFIPFVDAETSKYGNAYPMLKGESFEFEFDTLSAAEEQYTSPATPASGDQIVITVLAWEAMTVEGDLLSVSPNSASAKAQGGVSSVAQKSLSHPLG